MPPGNNQIGRVCTKEHCTNNAASPWWKGNAAPTFEGRDIHNLHADQPMYNRDDGKEWPLESERFVWFYIEVHRVCTQDKLAACIGRTHQAIRLIILRLRKERRQLTNEGVPFSDHQWDFIKPDPNPPAVAPIAAPPAAPIAAPTAPTAAPSAAPQAPFPGALPATAPTAAPQAPFTSAIPATAPAAAPQAYVPTFVTATQGPVQNVQFQLQNPQPQAHNSQIASQWSPMTHQQLYYQQQFSQSQASWGNVTHDRLTIFRQMQLAYSLPVPAPEMQPELEPGAEPEPKPEQQSEPEAEPTPEQQSEPEREPTYPQSSRWTPINRPTRPASVPTQQASAIQIRQERRRARIDRIRQETTTKSTEQLQAPIPTDQPAMTPESFWESFSNSAPEGNDLVAALEGFLRD